MKRFILDGLLIMILVMVGSSIMEKEKDPSISKQIELFEQDIVNHEILFPQMKGESVVEIKMNKASKLAQSSSNLIEKGVRFTVETLASIFQTIVE